MNSNMMLSLLLPALSAVTVNPPTEPAAVVHAVTCDAAPGEYEKQELPLPNGETVLRAHIRLLQTHPDEVWYPAAGLLFVLPGERRHTGVQVFVDPSDRARLTVGLKKPKDGSPVPISRVSASEPVEVTTQFKDGVVTVWTGQKSKSLRLTDKRIEGAFLMCSSGRFEIAP